MQNNKNTIVQDEPTQDEIDSSGLFQEKDNFSLESIAKERLSGDELILLKRIAYMLSKVGMRLEAACQMMDYPVDAFRALMEREPVVARIVRIKELKFKKDLMYTLSSRARGGNEKIALWLLERLYPEEFAEKKDAETDRNTTKDAMKLAIEFIRASGSNSPLVQASGGKGRRGTEEENNAATGQISGIEEILSGLSGNKSE
jgi:hypothetical protein